MTLYIGQTLFELSFPLPPRLNPKEIAIHQSTNDPQTTSVALTPTVYLSLGTHQDQCSFRDANQSPNH